MNLVQSRLQLVRSLYGAGRLSEARQACSALLREAPRDARACAIAGMLAFTEGDATAAERHYRRAIALEPRLAEARFNWGNALLELGRPAEAVHQLRQAAELRPDLSQAHNNLGSALRALGDDAGAEASYRRALELSPRAAHVHRNLGTVLRDRGAKSDALGCFERAAELRPDWPRALQSLATTAMELGRWSTAIESCRRWLSVQPANVEALGLLSIALDEHGESDEAAELLDVASLFEQRVMREPPPGFASMDAFNRALAGQISSEPSLAVPSADDPRYHCSSLRLSGEACASGPAALLRAWVQQQLRDYVARLRRTAAAHPFVTGGPDDWQLVSWAAVLDGEGQLEPHVHYRSYVSAVYYVQVPAMSGGPQAGWFELGGGPAGFPCRVRRPVHAVEPRAGALLLFPSYFYHRTLPFQAAEPRISIAFDSVAG